MTLRLNQLHAISTRLVTPSRGVWIADVDADLDATRIVPSGKVSLFLGGTSAPLLGTVDAKNSGRFGEIAKVRVLGGGGGWGTNVDAKHYHNDAGVLSTAVLATTAAEAGEVVVDTSPTSLGRDYVRGSGCASSVLEGRDWYVTLQGVTVVGPRPTIPASPDVEVLSWDPSTQRAEIGTNAIIEPGMLLVDPRFGILTVYEVEQTFTDAGSRASAWCTKAANVADALAAFIRAKSGALLLAAYRYRVVLQGVDERASLQAVEKEPGLPDLLPITMWPGVPGLGAMLTPGSEVLVEFIAGKKDRPVITQFDATPPISMMLTTPALTVTGVITAASLAAGLMNVTPTGMSVGNPAIAEPVAKSSALETWAAGVVAACAAASPPIAIPPLPSSFKSTLMKTV
ncbi:MAG: hypothetical protein JWM74_228 [Myxococcaceae bacterium]|nr:hypothetical protein [Myxococcaceae bacterium]